MTLASLLFTTGSTPHQSPPPEPITLVPGARVGGEITSAIGHGDRFYLTRVGRLETVDAATLEPIRDPFPIPGPSRLYAASDNGIVIAEFANHLNDVAPARLQWLDVGGAYRFGRSVQGIHLPLFSNDLRSGVLAHGVLHGISQQFGRPSDRLVFRIDFRDPDRPRALPLGDAPSQANAVAWRPGVLAFVGDEHLHLTTDDDAAKALGKLPLLGGEYATAAFADDWLILGDRTALIVDTADPTAPSDQERQVVGGGVEKITWASLAVGEGSAWVRHRSGAVWGVVDTADLPSLRGVATHTVSGSNASGGVAVAGRYAAMAAGQAGLAWSDAKTWRTVPVLGNPHSLAASTERLWAGDGDGEVWSMQPGSERPERQIEQPGPDRSPAAVAVVDNAVIAVWGLARDALGRIEIRAEAPPHERLAEWTWPEHAPHGIAQAPAIAVSGRRLFVSGPSGSLAEIDLTNLEAPGLVGVASAGGDESSGLTVADNVAYSANRDSGLVTFDVAGNTGPIPLGRFDLGSDVYDVAAVDGRVFAATLDGIFSVVVNPNGEIDVTGPFLDDPVTRLMPLDGRLMAVGWDRHGNPVWQLKWADGGFDVAAIGRLPYRLGPTTLASAGDRLFVGYGPAGVWEVRHGLSAAFLPSVAVP